MHLSLPLRRLLSVLRRWFCCSCWSIVCWSSIFVFVLLCITLCSFLFCNHLEETEKAVCFAYISYRCIAIINVLWLFLTAPWLGLQYVVVVFPDNTHLLLKQAQQSTSSNGKSKFSKTVQFLYTEFDVVVSTVSPLNHSPSI